jgi:poly-gamma-glutamate synthesis protein (capsule biosynthesis protein)
VVLLTASASPAAGLSIGASLAAVPSGMVRMVLGGDVMLARTVGRAILQDPATPFAGVASILRGADLAIVNLECTLGGKGSPVRKGYRFRGPAAGATALELAGINAVSQSNNHALDYGPAALRDTRQLLEATGVAVAGAGPDTRSAHQPALLGSNGLWIALLAYSDVPVERGGFDTRSWRATATSPGIAWVGTNRMRRDIATASEVADHVVVYFHFGYEGTARPTTGQRLHARAAIDAGATLVVGAHPHVLQGTERYGKGLIAYSLGNFVFDGDGWPAISHDGAMLEVRLSRTALEEFRWHPVVLTSDGFPVIATAAESARILRRVAPID